MMQMDQEMKEYQFPSWKNCLKSRPSSVKLGTKFMYFQVSSSIHSMDDRYTTILVSNNEYFNPFLFVFHV